MNSIWKILDLTEIRKKISGLLVKKRAIGLLGMAAICQDTFYEQTIATRKRWHKNLLFHQLCLVWRSSATNQMAIFQSNYTAKPCNKFTHIPFFFQCPYINPLQNFDKSKESSVKDLAYYVILNKLPEICAIFRAVGIIKVLVGDGCRYLSECFLCCLIFVVAGKFVIILIMFIGFQVSFAVVFCIHLSRWNLQLHSSKSTNIL